MSLIRAKQFLKNVILKTEIVPFTRYKYGVGRKAQLKNQKASSGRWPKKSAQMMSKILCNAESNAKMKGLEISSLFIQKVTVNQAMKGQRRTFRAHGRVNAFLNHPCHIEIVLTEKKKKIPKTFSK
mmetsp:Transcript_14021/g.27858  ORF Transcript_14021/g.27858 Transcript_14021/m.27858 type:complete len:126 (+) Transcript_14021:881-1258(+)